MAIITVKATGGTFNLTQLQSAIDAAVDGDTIQIQAGQRCTGEFILRNKGTLTAGITITTTLPEFCPGAGIRTDPAYASFMPKIKSPGGGSAVLKTASGANGWTLRHVYLENVPFGFETIFFIGFNDSQQTFSSQQPSNITVDRCIFMGGTVCGQKRAMAIHGANVTIANNYIDNIFSYGVDSQGMTAVNGTGPLTVINNFIRCGTYAFITGGADPTARTFMNITGTPTTTSADVTCSEAGHTLSELTVGQGIGLAMSGITGGWQWTTIRSISSGGASGTITFDAIPSAPTVGSNNAKCGVILNGLTFQKNYCTNDPTWFGRGALDTPMGLVSSTGTGSLAAGTYFYSVQAQHTTETYEANTNNGYSNRTGETSKTLGSSGSITVSWNAVANADRYIVWRGTSVATPTAFKVVTGATSLADDGTFGWTLGSPAPGSVKTIKNIFEIKATQNAQVDSNILEYCWQGGDVGFSVWLKTVNQDGQAPYLQSKNITFEKNLIAHVYGFLEVHGRERGNSGIGYPGTLDGLIVRNNLIFDSGYPWSNNGTSDVYAFNISAAKNVTVDHNTVVHITTGNGGGLMATDSSDSPLLTGFVMTNNMLRREAFGIHDSLGTDTGALNAATSGGYTFTKNAIADGGGSFPAGNFTEAAALWQAEFVNYVANGSGADFHLKSSSAYHNAGTDSKDLGCDIDLVLNAIASVRTGIPGSPSPDPPTTPTSPTPADTQTGVTTSPTVTWSGSGALSWDVYFGTASNPPLVVSSVNTSSYTPAPLANSTVYFWKVVARNNAGTTTGPIWSFTTLAQVTGPAHRRHGRFHR